jgi:hypothetical protein
VGRVPLDLDGTLGDFSRRLYHVFAAVSSSPLGKASYPSVIRDAASLSSCQAGHTADSARRLQEQ